MLQHCSFQFRDLKSCARRNRGPESVLPRREERGMRRPTMAKLINTLRGRLGNIVAHSGRPKPNDGRHGLQFTFPVRRREQSDVQPDRDPRVTLTQIEASGGHQRSGGRVDRPSNGPGRCRGELSTQLRTRIPMVKDVSGYAPGVPALETRSRVPPLNVCTEEVRVLGY